MRIVGGRLGGRVLRAPRGAATRPTSEKVREAVFAIIGADRVDGASVLDLFAPPRSEWEHADPAEAGPGRWP